MHIDDWPTLIKEYGPAALSVAGTLITILLSAIWATIGALWRMQRQRMDDMENEITKLCSAVRESRETLSDEADKIKDSLLIYRTEVHHLKSSVEPLKETIKTVEGAVKNQNRLIHDYAEKFGEINGQLDSVFRFIESYPRSKIERLK